MVTTTTIATMVDILATIEDIAVAMETMVTTETITTITTIITETEDSTMETAVSGGKISDIIIICLCTQHVYNTKYDLHYYEFTECKHLIRV